MFPARIVMTEHVARRPAPSLPRRRARRRLLAALAAAGALGAPALSRTAGGQDFHAANVQLLHGSGFHDEAAGNATRDGRMTTLTVEWASGWRYGDTFFFADLTRGDFEDGPTGRNRVYLEFSPRLSMSKITGRTVGAGPVGDVLIAASIDRAGSGFAANLIGLGVDLRLPGVPVAQLNVYHRSDSFDRSGYQVTGVWSAPVRTGALQWALAGFVDVAGSDAGTDVTAQPQLLLDLGAFLGRPGRVHAGTEWYLHRVPGGDDTSVPQAMLRLSW